MSLLTTTSKGQLLAVYNRKGAYVCAYVKAKTHGLSLKKCIRSKEISLLQRESNGHTILTFVEGRYNNPRGKLYYFRKKGALKRVQKVLGSSYTTKRISLARVKELANS
jgi:hypothetical protein